MNIEYKVGTPVSLARFETLLIRSTLAERRPVEDKVCLQGMLDNSNLVVTAWDNDKLVGIARNITDFHYACYLSDLAVDQGYQKCGIGKQLQTITQDQLGPKCKLILLAAPAANDYYQHIGFENNPRCWLLPPDQKIK